MPARVSSSSSTHLDSLRLPLPRLAERPFSASGHEIVAITDDALFDACGTRIAFTMRTGGMSSAPFESLNLSYAVGDDECAVAQNRHLVCEAMGAAECFGDLVAPVQVHGCDILEVDDVIDAQRRASLGVDGVACSLADVPVLLCFADCVPVALVAPDGSFAVVHAGWRGALGGIPGLGLAKLVDMASCPPEEVNCYVGPHIGACCYEFDAETLARFVSEFGPACDGGGRHLDLTQAVVASLRGAGADSRRIACTDACTSCTIDSFFSHRKERGKTGRHGAFAVRKEEL